MCSGAMTPPPATSLQGNHTLTISSSSSTSGPTSNPGSISIATDIAYVDKLERESYTRRCRKLERALEEKRGSLNPVRQLTDDEITDIQRRVDAEEAAGRVQAITITIPGGSESLSLSTLSHSYRLIRNLLWIEQHPVYEKALAEWEGEENLFASRIGRKLDRSRALQNDVYRMIGFYSVFQGVLLTASSQSSYLRCRNVWLPVALSAFASFGTLMHIHRKFKVSSELQKTIISEDIPLKEVKARIQALKEKGEAFRFHDFREDRRTTWSNFQPRRYPCGIRTEDLVLLAILFFSVVFLIAHPLILCRPGPA